MGGEQVGAMSSDWVARSTIQSLARADVARQKHFSQMAADIKAKRAKYLFGGLDSPQWPAVSYMQPCVPTSSQLNMDHSVRVTSAGVPEMGQSPNSSLQLRIQQKMDQRVRDVAALNEQSHLTTPYVYKDRTTFLAMEDRRRQLERARRATAPIGGLRQARDEFQLKIKSETAVEHGASLAS